jgi:hypothetical protein
VASPANVELKRGFDILKMQDVINKQFSDLRARPNPQKVARLDKILSPGSSSTDGRASTAAQ